MRVHFLFTIPIWLGLILLVIKAAAARTASKASTVAQVQRVIVAPDGRKATFVVPADEPVSVSIARMYPSGTIPTEVAPEAMREDRPRLAMSSVPKSRRLSSTPFWLRASIVAVALVILLLGVIRSQSANGPPRTVLGYQVASASPVLPKPNAFPEPPMPPAAAQEAEPLPSRVQLKTGANVRNEPSRSGAILRVGRKGDVFTKFGESNGWLQVGGTQPEGWVAQSVVTPIQ